VSDIAVRAEDLSKRYRLGHREQYSTLRDAISIALTAPFRPTGNGSKPEAVDGGPEFIWAVRGVSFSIRYGEVVGIIGGNGAGKSTLLKILSRITEPTEGEARIYGRVGSLLEVGTGFHPELTGRENIYLNGAILGMKKAEIERKFDEIVSFAEIEKFIDTAVKHYSTGMYMRLAFAVAANLEPEILIVDEVLAVGDAAFQKKCLGKMGEVAKDGRTVLFVSHNTAAIERLCGRTITLQNGQILFDGDSREAIAKYVDSIHVAGSARKIGVGEFDLREAPRGGKLANSSGRAFQSLSIRNGKGQPRDVVTCGEDVVFVLRYESECRLLTPTVGIVISCEPYGRLAFVQTRLQHGDVEQLPGKGELVCTIPRLPLAPGRYTLSLGLNSSGRQIDWIEDQVDVHVESADFFGTGHLPPPTHGPLLLNARWEFPCGPATGSQ
jgi:lipopolysaccharide transport system ATP-binding protein